MNVFLIGTGGVGEAVAMVAKEMDPQGEWLKKMVLANRTKKRAEEVSRRVNDPRFPVEQVDANDRERVLDLIRLHQIDLILNGCDPSLNEVLFDVAFAAGIDYMDMALSLSVPDPEDPYGKTNIKMGDYQFDQSARWEEKGLLALVGMGIDPGASNVLARYGQKHFFDEVEEISIKDGGNLYVEGHDVSFGFSIWTTIDECLNPPFKYEKGKGIYVVEPFSEPELFVFPDGIGEQELVNVEHEEMVMLPRTMGESVQRMSFKYGLGEDFITLLKNLKALGLDDKHSKVPGTDLSPRDVVGLVAPDPVDLADKMRGKVCVGAHMKGIKDGLPREIFLYQTSDSEETYARIGCGVVVGQTAYNPVIAMELLARGVWKGSGVRNPESFDPDPYVQLADAYDYPMGMMELDSPYKKSMDRNALLEAVRC